MKATAGIYYVSECGRVSQDPRTAAVLDVEHWLERQTLPVGQRNAAQQLCGILDEYPNLVECIMRKYQSALDDADQQSFALRPQLPPVVQPPSIVP